MFPFCLFFNIRFCNSRGEFVFLQFLFGHDETNRLEYVASGSHIFILLE